MIIQKDSGACYTTQNKTKQKVLAVLVAIIILVSQFSLTTFPSLAAVEQVDSYRYNSGAAPGLIGFSESILGIEYRSTGIRKVVFCREYNISVNTANNIASDFTPLDLSNSNIKRVNDVIFFGFTVKHPNFAPPRDGSDVDYNIQRDYYFTQYYAWEELKRLGFANSDQLGEHTFPLAQVIPYSEWKTSVDNDINDFYSDITYNNNVGNSSNNINGSVSNIVHPGDTIWYESNKFTNYTVVNNADLGNNVRFNHTDGSNRIYITIPLTYTGLRFIFTNTMAINIDFRSKIASFESDGYWVTDLSQESQKRWISSRPNLSPITFDILIDQTGSLDIIKVNDKNGQYDSFPLNDSPTSYTNNDLVAGSWCKLKGTTAAIDGVVELVDKNLEITDGHRQFDNITRGAYTLKEITAPTGYILNPNTITGIVINPGQTTTVGALNSSLTANTEPTGRLTIKKHDIETGADTQGEAVFAGAVYGLYADEEIWNKAHTVKHYNNNQLVTTRALNTSGEALIIGIPMGNYYVKEITPPTGYNLSPTETAVSIAYINQNTPVITVSSINTELVKKRRLRLYKTGLSTQSGQITGISSAGFAIKEYEKFQAALSAGYTYAEIWNGLDEYGDPVSVNALRVLQAQAIAPTVQVQTTNAVGIADFTLIPYAKYIVKEISAPQPFKPAPDSLIFIDKDEIEIPLEIDKPYFLHINDEEMKTYLQLRKRDKRSGELISLNSATFKIKARSDIEDKGNLGTYHYLEGQTIKQKVGSVWYDTWTTNADGSIIPATGEWHSDLEPTGTAMLPLILTVGEYELYEINTPNGFLENTDPIPFDIHNIQDYTEDPDGDPVLRLDIDNTQPTGKIHLDKYIKLGAQTNFANKGRGVVFQAPSNRNLLNGFTLPRINFTPLNTTEEETEIHHSLIPRNVDGDVDLSTVKFKLWAESDLIDMTTGETYYTDGLNNITAPAFGKLDPNYYPITTGAIIGEYNISMGSRGEAFLDIDNLPMGKYAIQEIETIPGCVINDTILEFEFSKEDETTTEYAVSLELENKPTITRILKLSTVSNEPIDGAELHIEKVVRDPDTGEIITGGSIDSSITSWASIKSPNTEERPRKKVNRDSEDNDSIQTQALDAGVMYDEHGYAYYVIEGLEVGQEYNIVENLPPEYCVTSDGVNFVVLDTTDPQDHFVLNDPMATELDINKYSLQDQVFPGDTLDYEVLVYNNRPVPAYDTTISDMVHSAWASIVKDSIKIEYITTSEKALEYLGVDDASSPPEERRDVFGFGRISTLSEDETTDEAIETTDGAIEITEPAFELTSGGIEISEDGYVRLDITDYCRIVASDKGFYIDTYTDLMQGEFLLATYKVKVSEDMPRSNKELDNIAKTLAHNDSGKDKSYTITTPPDTKLEVDKKAGADIAYPGSSVPYTIDVTNTTTIKAHNVVVKDTIQTTHASVNKNSILISYITSKGSIDITRKADITVKDNSFTIEINTDLYKGDTIHISYSIRLGTNLEQGISLKNIANAWAWNAEDPEDSDTIKIPAPKPIPAPKTGDKVLIGIIIILLIVSIIALSFVIYKKRKTKKRLKIINK